MRAFQELHRTGVQGNCLAGACPVTAVGPCRTGAVRRQAEETGPNLAGVEERPQEVVALVDPRGRKGTCPEVVVEEALDIHPELAHHTVVDRIHAALVDHENTDRLVLQGREDSFPAVALGIL